MSYLALARKYRPEGFGSIVSQHHITTTLKNAVSSGRISHAYLFCGPRGTGKTTTARVLAKSLNCEKGPTPEPCGECTVCKEIAQCSSPDVFEIDAASNRGIDDIRELRENVRYAPVSGKYKIYIVDEVHRLTREAFDALLKTLEEPPAHVIFIFATTEPQALPATILSRTQRYDFKRIPVSALAETVNAIAQKESLIIDPLAALMIAKKADGSLRDALSLLDQLSSYSQSKIDSTTAAELIGIVKTEFLCEITSAVIGHDTSKALTLFGEFVNSGGDPVELSEALLGYIRALMLIKNGVDDVSILEMDSAEIENSKEMVEDIDSLDILRYFTILADYKGAVKSGQDPRFAFEAALVKLSTLDRAVTIESLLNGDPGNHGNTKSAVPPKPDANDDKPERTSFSKPVPKRTPPPKNSHVEPEKNNSNIAPPSYEGDLDIDVISAKWESFCRFVGQNDKAVFAHLSLSMPSKFENDILTVGVDDSHNFQFVQLNKIGMKNSIEESLEKYFSRPLKLRIIQGPSEGKKADDLPGNLSPEKLFDGSPAAKKLFDLMDGEILSQ